MIFTILLNVMAPIFLVILVGAIAAQFTTLEMRALNRFALYTAIPALTFRALTETSISFTEVTRLVLAFLLFLAIMALGAKLLGYRLDTVSRRGLIATSTFGNAANMMLPVSLFALGDLGLERALILYIVSSLVMFTVGPLVLSTRSTAQSPIRTLITFPVLWACAAGLVVGAIGWTLPAGISRGVSMLADAAVPLVLLTLGIQIGRVKALRPTTLNWAGAALKLLVGPAVGYGAGALLGLTGIDLAVLILLAAMPPAVNNFMLALEFGGNSEQIGRTVILATLGALVSLPVVVTLLHL